MPKVITKKSHIIEFENDADYAKFKDWLAHIYAKSEDVLDTRADALEFDRFYESLPSIHE